MAVWTGRTPGRSVRVDLDAVDYWGEQGRTTGVVQGYDSSNNY